ncbi:MAG: methyltransferase family protein [Bacteroidota bacterium]
MNNRTLNYTTLVIPAVASPVFLYYIITNYTMDMYRIIGLVIVIPSFLLLIIARIQLGGSFSLRAQADQLVTSGLYSKIRHPIYFFGLIYISGWAFCLKTFYIILLAVLVLIMQIRRSRKEEKVLEEKFGKAYTDYKQTTWF